MRIECASLSTEGSARERNEDSIAQWIPNTAAEWRSRGALIVLADGMGGQVRGEVASRMACERTLETFLAAPENTDPPRVLQQCFNAANLSIFDDNLNHDREWGRMATTLTVTHYRHDEVNIAHVGDCRVYLIQQNRIRQLTTDHSYAAAQLKLGLVSAVEASTSQFRSVLTRSVGNDPIVRPDFLTVKVRIGDMIVQCCDGLWSKVTDGEIQSIAGKQTPQNACQQLIRLAEKRFADDNLSVQVIEIVDIERLSRSGGRSNYWKERESTMESDLQIGQKLDDRYEITDTIAQSGMAAIYKATDTKLNQTVALKVPFLRFESDPGFFSRFQREQKIGHALNHPYVLRLLDTPDQDKSRPYMVMEYLEGQTLGQLMQVMSPMPVDDALKLAARVCEALDYLHENDVVHRDLKPDNIMICNDGSIRVMDFGIAKYDGQRRLTFGGFTPAMGTPDYMAPEQVRGKRGDRRTDLYSLGAILYEMVTGKTPFSGENPFVIMNNRVTGDPPAPRKIKHDLSPQVEEIILHAMSRDPADRYATAAEMRAELEAPDKVVVTGRADRLVEPNPIRMGMRKYWFVAVGLLIPLVALLVWWASKHVHIS